MGAAERTKGAAAERALAKLLSDELGVPVKRMLGQERDGGADICLGALRIQVKRCERLELAAWWRQTIADAGDGMPVLAYRASRQPWRFRMLLADVAGEIPCEGHDNEWAELPMQSFLWFVREYVPFDLQREVA